MADADKDSGPARRPADPEGEGDQAPGEDAQETDAERLQRELKELRRAGGSSMTQPRPSESSGGASGPGGG